MKYPSIYSAITLFVTLSGQELSAANSSLDLSFGINGIAPALIASDNEMIFDAIVLNSTGSLDSRFSSDGKVQLDLDYSTEFAGLTRQQDGNIIAIGMNPLYGGTENFVVVRLTGNGSRDSGFGEMGVAETDFTGKRDQAHTAIILKDGGLRVGGLAMALDEGKEFGLAAYASNGHLQQEFGSNGILMFHPPGEEKHLTEFLRQPDGKILAGGGINGVFLLARKLLPQEL